MKNNKILIVEDEAIIAADIETLIQNMGYVSGGICSGADDAVRMARETKPDLILMDIALRGSKTGITAINEIREFMKPAVIYITAFSDIAVLREAIGTEPEAYVIKPFDRARLSTCIKLVLVKHEHEKLMADRIKELKNEKDAGKRAVIDKDIEKLKEQAEASRKVFIKFINSKNGEE